MAFTESQGEITAGMCALMHAVKESVIAVYILYSMVLGGRSNRNKQINQIKCVAICHRGLLID